MCGFTERDPMNLEKNDRRIDGGDDEIGVLTGFRCLLLLLFCLFCLYFPLIYYLYCILRQVFCSYIRHILKSPRLNNLLETTNSWHLDLLARTFISFPLFYWVHFLFTHWPSSVWLSLFHHNSHVLAEFVHFSHSMVRWNSNSIA